VETSGKLFGRPKYSLTVNTGVDRAFVFLLAMIMEKRDAEWSRHLDGGGGHGGGLTVVAAEGVVAEVVVVAAALKDCGPTLDRFIVDHVI
jgi:hypothetical protein